MLYSRIEIINLVVNVGTQNFYMKYVEDNAYKQSLHFLLR